MADRLDYLLSELGGSSSDEEGEAVTEAEAAEWAEARQPRPQPQQQVPPDAPLPSRTLLLGFSLELADLICGNALRRGAGVEAVCRWPSLGALGRGLKFGVSPGSGGLAGLTSLPTASQVLPPPPPHPISAPAEADDQEKLEEEGIKEEAKGEGKGEARPDVASGVVSAGLAEVACSAGPEGDSAAAAWDSATAASPGTDGLSKDTLAKPLSPLAAGNDGIIRTPSAGGGNGLKCRRWLGGWGGLRCPGEGEGGERVPARRR